MNVSSETLIAEGFFFYCHDSCDIAYNWALTIDEAIKFMYIDCF